jgi:hypothetical protein
MNYKTRAVAILFLLGMTFTSFSLIEARQNLRVATFGVPFKNDECMIVSGSFGTTSPGPRISLGSCDDDYALDVEFESYNENGERLTLTDSNGDSGCMSHWNNDWLAANVCVQFPESNHVWQLVIEGEGIGGILSSADGKCVEYFPDSETESLRMVDCIDITTTFALVDAPLVDAPFDCSVDFDTKPYV